MRLIIGSERGLRSSSVRKVKRQKSRTMWKKTYKETYEKEPPKKINQRDQWKRPMEETYERDLWKRPMKETYERDLWETYVCWAASCLHSSCMQQKLWKLCNKCYGSNAHIYKPRGLSSCGVNFVKRDVLRGENRCVLWEWSGNETNETDENKKDLKKRPTKETYNCAPVAWQFIWG